VLGSGSAIERSNRPTAMRLTCSRSSSKIFASSKIDNYTSASTIWTSCEPCLTPSCSARTTEVWWQVFNWPKFSRQVPSFPPREKGKRDAMSRLQRFLWLFVAFLVTANPVAADDSPHSSRALKGDPEQSRHALEEKARQDPEWYQRTLRDLDAFQSLPADQQERMRNLDRQLNAQDSRTRQKLMRALERYSAW